MAVPLLTTKLNVPPPRPNLVPRLRLVERLDDGLRLGRRLVLISAPAGFGKTTLLSQWAHGRGRSHTGPYVAWLSLDEGDNDPTRFWSYVIAALQTIPGLGRAGVGEAARAALHSPGFVDANASPPIEALLTGLINEIAAVPAPCALVLDDFHVITDRSVNDAFTFFLDNMPPHMQVLLASRSDPPWSLARRRASGEIAELRADDLRFTPIEVAAFLNQVMGLGLSAQGVAALDGRTEGWIAGLQMAALSMRERKDASGFIAAFAGTHRFILDYLVEEVLDQHPPDLQEFLLGTSILERMTSSLCDAVMARADGSALSEATLSPGSQAILIQLEQANLFLVPLDDQRRWYRYHHLFADLLRSRLEQTQPDRVPTLHRRAGEWYEQNGLITEAVSHMLAAGDVEQVARLVEGNALAMMDRGELRTLAEWLDILPDEVMSCRPWLCIAYAWVLAYVGHFDAIEPQLEHAENAWADPERRAEIRHVAGHAATIRGYTTALKGDMSRAVELARRALEHLPEGDLRARGVATAVLGGALKEGGDLVAAAQALDEAISIGQAAGDSHVAVINLCDLTRLQVLQGRLHEAVATCQYALRLADEYAGQSGWRLPVTGHVYTHLSRVLREWNDLEAATPLAREGIQLCRQWGWVELLVHGGIYLAQTLQVIGDAEGALDAIRTAREAANGLSTRFVGLVEAHEALLWLAQGDVAAASRWARQSGLSVRDELGFQERLRYLALARVLVARGRLDDALGLLARLLTMAQAAGAMGYVIAILILQAIARHAQGQDEQALAPLERALALAQPEGYVRSFIDAGLPMAQLLRQAVARGIAVDYAGKLLAALEGEMGEEGRVTASGPSPWVEPLSERELEVLRLLTTHLSSTEIAEELFISANTVRSHVKSIYGKLNVHSRKDAVQRAQELELV